METYPVIEKEFINTGKIKLVIKEVDFSGRTAVNRALKLALCINEYGNFSKLHQLLMVEPNSVFTVEFDKTIDALTEADNSVAECFYGGYADSCLNSNLKDLLKNNLLSTPVMVVNNKAIKGFKTASELKEIFTDEDIY